MQTFNNFADMGAVFGVFPKKPRKEKPFVCRKCGWVMDHVPGTNVYICSGRHSDGTECENVVLTKSIA